MISRYFLFPCLLILVYQNLSSDILIIKDLFCIGFSIPMICPPHTTNKNQESCVFCKTLHNIESRDILYSDDEYLAFRDINPSAFLHFLVIPRQHLGTVIELSENHGIMVKRMKEIALKIFKNQSVDLESSRMGFHLPPFNSIHHLHLHGIGKPFKNIFRALKYTRIETPWWTSVFF